MVRPATRLPVSLVIPAYRAEAYLASAIASVTGAAVVPTEIIVVDDGSDDRTAAVAAAAGADVIRLPRNGGPSRARNIGVAAATQPWVAFLDADDIWCDGKLAAQWDALSRWPDAGFCFTDYDVVSTSGHVTQCETTADRSYRSIAATGRIGDLVRFEQRAFARGLVRSMFVRQSSLIVNRERFFESGGYDETLRLGEDHDLLLRLIALAPAVAVERSLVVYVRRPESLSADPLASIAAIDRLWSTVLARPAPYPAAAVAAVPRQRHRTLRMGFALALRLGRFSDALPFARRAASLDRSPASLALVGLASALDNPASGATFRILRSVWRARPNDDAVAR
jgi:glycosyltransferase involved in cell wall biosynthesis